MVVSNWITNNSTFDMYVLVTMNNLPLITKDILIITNELKVDPEIYPYESYIIWKRGKCQLKLSNTLTTKHCVFQSGACCAGDESEGRHLLHSPRHLQEQGETVPAERSREARNGWGWKKDDNQPLYHFKLKVGLSCFGQ